jgi:hypothetical protein
MSQPQHMAALNYANYVRYHHAEAKRRLRTRKCSLIDVMGDPLNDSMKVADALLALPRIGRVKANKIMHRLEMSPGKTLGTLTYRQRVELDRAFRR